jgi:hypothetical protein
MKVVQRRLKRQHRLVWVGVHPRDLPAQQPEVAEFRDRHLAQGRLVGERRCQRRILGKPEESDEFRVSQQAEQVQDTIGSYGGLIIRRLAGRGVSARRGALTGRRVGHFGSLTTSAP